MLTFLLDLPSFELFRNSPSHLSKRAEGKATCPQYIDDIAVTTSHLDNTLNEAIESIRSSFSLVDGNRVTLKRISSDTESGRCCSTSRFFGSTDNDSSFRSGLASLRYIYPQAREGFVSQAVQTDINPMGMS
jgi:hypothetical protein